MPDRITGMVAQILNDRELVINRGTEQGVETGMRFAVLAEEEIDISDPETGEPLGNVERPKTMVKVTQVQPKLAVAATYRTRVYGSSVLGMYRYMSDEENVEHETLSTRDSRYSPLSEEESKVVRGDRVVQVVGDEFAGWDW